MTDFDNLNDSGSKAVTDKKSSSKSKQENDKTFDDFYSKEIKKAKTKDEKKETDKTIGKSVGNCYNVSYSVNQADQQDKKASTSSGTTPNGSTAAKAKSNKGDIGVWIITILILGAFLFLILWAGSKTPKLYGSITGEPLVRYGSKNELSLNLGNTFAAEDKEIVWYVDGKEVKRATYGEQDALTLNLAQSGVAIGEHTVTVHVGDQKITEMMVNVAKPLLKISAPNLQISYGEATPSISANAQGWVDGDTAESVGFNGVITLTQDGLLPVGEYKLDYSGFNSDKYEVSSISGVLEVLPKKLTLSPCQFTKVYDGTTTADNTQLTLVGVVEGDLVGLNATVEYENKHAAQNKKVFLKNCSLTGDDKDNYTFDCEGEQLSGSITPLNVTVTGITANDKVYDGTTTVTFVSAGELKGILPTDNVGVGELVARFADNRRGTHKPVIIQKITLIGEDSQNYIATSDNVYANIVGKKTTVVPSN